MRRVDAVAVGPSAYTGIARAACAMLALMLLWLWAPANAPAAGGHHDNYLMVSDPSVSKVYFYRVPSMTLTGELSNVNLGSAANPMHGGAIVLEDGRIIVNDETQQRTLVVKLDRHGIPRILASIPSKLGDEPPWTAVDEGGRYYAVTSNGGGTAGPAPAPGEYQTGTELLNVIDLRSYENRQFEIPMKNTGEDLTPLFGGDPLTLFLGVGGREMRVHNVARLLNGDAAPTSTAAIGPASHGGFSAPETGTVGITTGAEPANLGTGPGALPNPDNRGLDVLEVACPAQESCGEDDDEAHPRWCELGACPGLASAVTVPWNADGLTLAKGNRVRVGYDGEHVITPLNVDLTPGIATDWSDVRLDMRVTDLEDRTARRISVGSGATSRGFPTSKRFAVEPIIHPKAAGAVDELKIVDVDPDSGSYLQVVRTVALKQMARGPVGGLANTYPEYERRFAAITPDGRHAFVTRGGDATIDMVDTASGHVTEIATPSSLTGGGHITALQLGLEPFDLSGR